MRNVFKISSALIWSVLLLGIFTSCKKETKNNTLVKLDNSLITFTEVDSIIRQAMTLAKVPGLQLAYFNDKKLKYMQSYGFKDSLNLEPMNNHTVLQSASFSKSIFACVLLKLVEQGLFDLDKPVHEYLKIQIQDLKNDRFDYKDLKNNLLFEKVTGRMLLSHTAGFRNYRNKDSLKIYFEPGSQYHYSGEGIILLQSIIEHYLQKDLNEIAQSYLFNPLGMTKTSFVWQEEFEYNTSYGFMKNGKPYKPRIDTFPMASYSCVTTISDFSILIDAILNQDFLKTEFNNEMLTVQHNIRTKNQFGSDAFTIIDQNTQDGTNLAYGLGWGLLETPVGTAFFKEGKNPGFQNMSIVFKNGKGLIIMTNSDNGEQLFQYLNEHLISNTYFPWKWESIYPFYVNQIFFVLNKLIEENEDVNNVIEAYNSNIYKVKCDEYSEDIFLALASIYNSKNQIDNAIIVLKKSLEKNHNSIDLLLSLSETYLNKNEFKLARETINKVLLIDHNNSTALSLEQKIKRK